MGLFGKAEDYKEPKESKQKEEFLDIEIHHCHGENKYFTISKANEYHILELLTKLSTGTLISATIEDSDKDKWIFTSKYIQDSVILIRY